MGDAMPRSSRRAPSRGLLLRLGVGAVGVAVVAAGIRSAPSLLARVPLFRVATVTVEGTALIDDRDILAAAAVPDTASLWDDPAPWEARVVAHPVVRRARIRRRLPGTLVIEVEEREPVAFVATPVLEPVDAEGRLLPVDPSRVRMDLPVVRLREGAGDTLGPSPHRLRLPVEAVVRLRRNAAFHGRLSELREEADGSVTAFWGSSPGLEVRMRLPVDPALVDDGLDVLALALTQDSSRTPHYLDLRWAEQVVVGYGSQ